MNHEVENSCLGEGVDGSFCARTIQVRYRRHLSGAEQTVLGRLLEIRRTSEQRMRGFQVGEETMSLLAAARGVLMHWP